MFRHVTNAENKGASCRCFFDSSWLRRIVDGKPWYPITEFSTVYIYIYIYPPRIDGDGMHFECRMCSLFVWKIRSTSCRRSSNRSRDQTEGTRNRQIHIVLLDHRIIILKTQCYRDKLRPVNNGFNKAIRFDNGIDRAFCSLCITVHFPMTHDDDPDVYRCVLLLSLFTRYRHRLLRRALRVEFTLSYYPRGGEGRRELIIFHAIDSHLYWLLEKDEMR